MPTQTDRDKIKDQQEGTFLTAAGIVDAKSAVAQLHEETFVFSNVAGSPLAEVGIHMRKKCKVKAIVALPAATLTTAVANYVTGTVAKRDGIGGSATPIGSFTTNSSGGAALTAFQPTTVTVSNTAGVADIEAGQVLTYALVDNATTTEVAVFVSVTVEYV